MSDELTQLKDDLAKLLEAAKIYDARYKGADWKATLGIIETRIARLEAEQADPWRKAKEYREWRRTEANHPGFEALLQHYDHLTAENADLRQKYDLANETIKTATGRLNETKGELTAAKIMIADRDDKISALTARVAALEGALKRIAKATDCGCVPCRGQCDSVENLKINAVEIREIARAALQSAKGGDGGN